MQVEAIQNDNVSAVAATSSASTSTTNSSSTSASTSTQSLSSALDETLAAVYSTSVGGTNYSGDVVEVSGGVYEASVPNVPGADATGSSIQGAENSLSARIDALV